MYSEILARMRRDGRVVRAIKERHRAVRRGLFLYAVTAFVIALLVCLSAELQLLGWCVTWLLAAAAVLVPLYLLHRAQKRPKVLVGKITRMEEDRKIVPQRGSEMFGRFHARTEEVHRLLIALTDERGRTEVIFCPAQHEKILKVGDTLLCHAALPYPAHLSNPTKCICMHCGTMQASENRTCITCGACIYSLYTTRK